MLSFFKKIEGWFATVFKNAPAWNVTALSALNIIAPLVETVVDLADPALGAVMTPIVTQVQAALGTTSQLLAAGNTSGLTGLLNSIQTNFSSLLTEAHITDPASVAKANAAATTLTSEIQAILAAIPAAA